MYYWILLALFIFLNFQWIQRNQSLILALIATFLVVVVLITEQNLKAYRSSGSSSTIDQLKQIVKPLLTAHEFANLKLYDMKANFKGKGVAFTLRKSEIYICTMKKDAPPNTPEELDVLTYVLIHELTHHLCKKCVQHDKNFHVEFRKMLNKADQLGIKYRIKPAVCGKCLL